MKKIYLALLCAVIFVACKKDKNLITNELETEATLILQKISDKANLSKADSKLIVDYLDKATEIQKKLFLIELKKTDTTIKNISKSAKLMSQSSFPKNDLKDRMIQLTQEEEVSGQLFTQIQDVPANVIYDEDGDLEHQQHTFMGDVYIYKWTVATIGYPAQVGGVRSLERVEVVDEGSFKPWGSRYSIANYQHSGSHLYGFTALLGYEELANSNYYGIYHFATYVQGRVSFMGIGQQCQSSRIVNTHAMVQSSGKAVNQY